MNLSDIKTGDIISNYPEMCNLLQENVRRGNPKVRQIEGWKRFFNYEKKGHKFYIIEIYETEKPKIDGRKKGNNSTYVEYTSLLLLSYLLDKHEDNKLNTTEFYKKEIKTIMGLCNDYFIDNDEKFFDKLYKEEIIKKLDKENFYLRANNKMSEVIKSTINYLNKHYEFIEIKKIYSIVENNNSISTERVASNEEELIIHDAHECIRKRLGANNMFAIYRRHQEKVFYAQVNEFTFKKHNWTIKNIKYLVTFNEEISILRNKYFLTQEKTTEYINKVNNAILKSLDKQEEYKISNNVNELLKPLISKTSIIHKKVFTPPKSLNTIPETKYKKHDKYVENQKYLSNLLIRCEIKEDGIS